MAAGAQCCGHCWICPLDCRAARPLMHLLQVVFSSWARHASLSAGDTVAVRKVGPVQFVFTRQPAGPACRATAPASSDKGGSKSGASDSGSGSPAPHRSAGTAGMRHAAKRPAQQQFVGDTTAESKRQRGSTADAVLSAAASLEAGGRQDAESRIPSAAPGPSSSSSSADSVSARIQDADP
jgi:hypothetical protein